MAEGRLVGVRPIVYGTESVMEEASLALGLPIRFVSADKEAVWPEVRLVEAARLATPIEIGTVSAEAGRLAFAAIRQAIEDAMAGKIAAIVTGPISKEAVNLAGFTYAGHTEILADLAKAPGTCMMLAHGDFRVSHVSTHVALSRVSALVTPERLTRVVGLTADALAAFGIEKPKIAVAALNPHAGEGGLFGHEDAEVIAPTVAALRAQGIDVTGPLAGDTVFVRAHAGAFDAVVAMFHDGAHPGQAARFQGRPGVRQVDFAQRHQHHPRSALRTHFGRSRNGFRHRRQGHRVRAEHGRGNPDCSQHDQFSKHVEIEGLKNLLSKPKSKVDYARVAASDLGTSRRRFSKPPDPPRAKRERSPTILLHPILLATTR